MTYDMYNTATQKCVKAELSLSEAAALMELEPGDILHWIEENGRVDNETHTLVESGTPFPGPTEDHYHGA